MKLPLVMADNCRVRKFQFPYDRHIENDLWRHLNWSDIRNEFFKKRFSPLLIPNDFLMRKERLAVLGLLTMSFNLSMQSLNETVGIFRLAGLPIPVTAESG